MSESRPTTQKLDRTHLMLPQRKSPLASTHLMAPPPAQVQAPRAVPAPSQMPPAHQSAPQQRAAAPYVAAPSQVSQVSAPVRAYSAHAVQAMPPVKPCSPTADPRVVMMADPHGTQAAGYRALRDTLITKNMPRLLAVTSAEVGEGKTTCAINLALALAEHSNERIVLLDANFESPAIANILGVDDSGPAWLAPFTLSAITPSLHVATLLRREEESYIDVSTLARTLGALHRAGYQRVVMDTACVSGDTMPVLSLAGGVLLATRAGSSKQRALRKVVDKIGAERCVGVMLLDA
jgi:Mrp family chromosome partitioning ATPase